MACDRRDFFCRPDAYFHLTEDDGFNLVHFVGSSLSISCVQFGIHSADYRHVRHSNDIFLKTKNKFLDDVAGRNRFVADIQLHA